jgi:WD40 repeat protein
LENKGYARRFALSPDGKTLALLIERPADGGVELWDVAAKKRTATLKPDGYKEGRSVDFTSDGKSLVVLAWYHDRGKPASAVASFDVWDLATLKVQRAVMARHDHRINGEGVLTPDGKSMIYPVRDQGAVMYDLATGKPTRTIDADPSLGGAAVVALSPDGGTLAIGSSNGVLLIWDLEKGKARHTLQPDCLPMPGAELLNLPPRKLGRIDLLAFSPDGKALASYGDPDRKVDLWDPSTGKNIDFLRPGSVCVGRIRSLAFSPDGKMLAFGGLAYKDDNAHSTVELWDLAAGGFRADFEADSKGIVPVEFLAFSADGKTLVAGAAYNPVEFWDVPAGKPDKIKPFELTPEQQKALRDR